MTYNPSETQRMRDRKAQEQAERNGRMIALALIIEIVGFSVVIILELIKA
jgi:hypothetical protein